MDTSVFMAQLGYAMPLMLGGIGSALGILNSGRAAAGEWAKEGKSGLAQRFTYVVFTGMPLSQTLYGYLFMQLCLAQFFIGASEQASAIVNDYGVGIFSLDLGCGIIELASAWVQGILGAAGCRAVGDSNGKGFILIVSIMGIAETVGLLGFVFFMLLMKTM